MSVLNAISLGKRYKSRRVVDDVSLTVSSGQVVGLLGPNGAGKTTCFYMIVGLIPCGEGRIELDNVDLTRQPMHQRASFGLGYLPQDVELFEGSVAENIARFGDVDPDKVIEAAQRTGIHDMILRFPAGYDTPMGEAGSFLSGGQRQRIGLARAIYGNPRLIVLDEPNANLELSFDEPIAVSVGAPCDRRRGRVRARPRLAA